MESNMRIGVTRRDLIATATGAAIGAGLSPLVRAAATARPNIVWIMADDLGYADISFTGRNSVKTPNIDRIALEGAFLRQSYSNSAVCSATRVGLITGRYQYRLRVGLDEPLGRDITIGLPPSHPTLPSLLRAQGYRTALVGKWHLGEGKEFGPLLSGYDRFYGILKGGTDYFRHQPGKMPGTWNAPLLDGARPANANGYLTDLLAQRAVSEIEQAKAAAAPLFMSLHFTAPHWPWEGPEDRAVADTLTDLQHRDGGNLRIFQNMIKSLDSAVGRVLAALDSARMSNDTIVIFTSDNGGERFSDTWPFVGAKTELLEGGIRVPFFIRWPARIRAGSSSEQVNISMDWVPTLLAAAGTQPHPDFPSDGRNLLDVVTGNAPVFVRQLYWRYKAGEQAALRDGDWKYLKIGKREWLFDLAQDEREQANLAVKEAARFTAMKRAWTAWNASMLPYPDGSSSSRNSRPFDLE
jgi:arylsulfatase A-like enzyme